MPPILVAVDEREEPLGRLPTPLPLGDWLPVELPGEVELGFGKGRYLLRRAAEEPEGRFLGLEMAGKYYRLADHRRRGRGLSNVVLLRGEALYLMSAVLPAGFAAAVHVYFPDPWPKARHQKRRLFDPETVDLVLGLLAPGGELFFATDHLEYGEAVAGILDSHPALAAVGREAAGSAATASRRKASPSSSRRSASRSSPRLTSNCTLPGACCNSCSPTVIAWSMQPVCVSSATRWRPASIKSGLSRRA